MMKIIKYTFKNLRFHIIKLISLALVLSVRSKCISLSALIVRLTFSNSPKIGSIERRKKSVLILPKSASMDDLEAALIPNPLDYRCILVPRWVFKTIIGELVTVVPCDGYLQLDDSKTERELIEYRSFLRKLIERIDAKIGVAAIINANPGYHAEVELAAACSQIGIPFICCYKETNRYALNAANCIDDLSMYKARFLGWRIALYNSEAKKALVKAGNIRPWQAEVLGSARLDYSHALRRIKRTDDTNTRKTLLYYLIQENVTLPRTIDASGNFVRGVVEQGRLRTWNNLSDRTNEVLLQFARNNPEWDIILKTKTGNTQLQLAFFSDKSLPSNVKTVEGGAGHSLLNSAHIVIAFNSTAILEAVAAGIPTITPHLLADDEKALRPYVFGTRGATYTPCTPDEFRQVLIALRNSDARSLVLTDKQEILLKSFLGNPDARSGERINAFIRRCLDTPRATVVDKTKTFFETQPAYEPDSVITSSNTNGVLE